MNKNNGFEFNKEQYKTRSRTKSIKENTQENTLSLANKQANSPQNERVEKEHLNYKVLKSLETADASEVKEPLKELVELDRNSLKTSALNVDDMQSVNKESKNKEMNKELKSVKANRKEFEVVDKDSRNAKVKKDSDTELSEKEVGDSSKESQIENINKERKNIETNKNNNIEAKNDTMANEQLSELIKLLTLKIAREEDAQEKINISVENFSKIIPDFDGKNIPIDDWFDTFESNASAYELTEKQKYVQCRNKVSGTAKLFLETVNVTNYNDLKQQLVCEFRKTYNCNEVHKMLSNKRKSENESFHEYMLQMRKIATLGNFDELSVIRYIVDGLKMKSEYKYQLYGATTFKELRERYEIYEHIRSEFSDENKTKNNKGFQMKKERCFNCGSTEHKKYECKSLSKCFKCNKFGHIAKDCRLNTFNKKDVEKSVNVIVDKNRYKTITINGKELECLVDTGSDVSIIKEHVFKSNYKDCELRNNKTLLFGFGNKKTIPIGCFTGSVKVDTVETDHDFVIVPNNTIKCEAILGYDFTRKFKFYSGENGFTFENKGSNETVNELDVYNINLIELDVDLPYKEKVEKLINSYKPVVPREECPISMKIILNNEFKPFRHSPSRLPIQQEQIVNNQIAEWLEKEIIRESVSDMASRIVLTKKKSGDYRVCIDYRQLNKMVLKDCFPVPLIDDVLLKLQKAKVFIAMDLENGFFHVPVHEDSKKYTAFITKQGVYEFNRAPFGFCNSPANFIRYVSYIFQNLINTDVMEIYIDDIILYGETTEECLEKLKLVLDRAAKFDLKFKWSKCSFLKNKIEFLGHTVEHGTVSPSKSKIRTVQKFPTPKNVKDVQAFLGLTGYFRKFVQRYAHIAKPLTNLLKKDTPFQMTCKELSAIEELKSIITSEPVLKIYCRNARTELHTDASKEGFGATLFQLFDEQLHPVFYWSKRASPQESKLHSYIMEVKAAYLAIKKFRHYLLGVEFKLVTDCAAFKQTIAKQDIPRDVAQWVMYLQDFSYIVEHRPGTRMKHVDCLSRYPTNVMVISSEVTARIRRMQQKDDYIKAISLILQSHAYEDFKIKGGVIYKSVDGNDLLLVPKAMEAEIIKSCHENGHLAVAKTMHAVKQQFYIPHVEKKVTQIVQNCIKCIIHNKKLGKKEGMLHCIEKGDLPLHTLHIDHLGPMDATCKKYKYILAIVDGFSKFIWLFTTKTTNTDEVIKNLVVWSDTFGNPNRIISDKGAAFTSQHFKEYCEQNAIEHILTTTGVPRGNGQIERVNRCILSIIAKLSYEDSSKWYKFVGQVQKALNSCVHSSTRSTPFEILFGIKMKITPENRILDILQNELVDEFDKDRQQLRNEAKQQILKAQEAYKKQYDKGRKNHQSYTVGDLVAIKRTQFTAGKKLANEFLGPYRVERVKRNERYDVSKAAQFEGPNNTSTSGDFMKPWKGYDEEEVLSSETDDYQDGRV